MENKIIYLQKHGTDFLSIHVEDEVVDAKQDLRRVRITDVRLSDLVKLMDQERIVLTDFIDGTFLDKCEMKYEHGIVRREK